jgi:hypothetical protein
MVIIMQGSTWLAIVRRRVEFDQRYGKQIAFKHSGLPQFVVQPQDCLDRPEGGFGLQNFGFALPPVVLVPSLSFQLKGIVRLFQFEQ